MTRTYDLAVVGAGILGLAHALAASRLGLKVIVIDRDSQANGASVRNFGFITVTGQERGATWQRASRSRDIWAELAPHAGIRIEHSGLVLAARRPEALVVLEAFMATEMNEGCQLLGADEARSRYPEIAAKDLCGALWSSRDLRVESRAAIPLLARFLEEKLGVTFLRSTFVHNVEPPAIETSAGTIRAEAAVVCPGDDFVALFPDRLARYDLTRCKLHMMRLGAPGFRLPGSVMTDLSLVRYLGYAALPEAEALRARLETEQAEHLANGVHLIVVQSADGSLVVGDSHHYAATPDPFAPEEVDALILDEYKAVLGTPPKVLERWTGTYASAKDRTMFTDAPSDRVRLVVITSGTGASTSFAIAEETIRDLTGLEPAIRSLAA